MTTEVHPPWHRSTGSLSSIDQSMGPCASTVFRHQDGLVVGCEAPWAAQAADPVIARVGGRQEQENWGGFKRFLEAREELGPNPS
jgi:hypothetical protein